MSTAELERRFHALVAGLYSDEATAARRSAFRELQRNRPA